MNKKLLLLLTLCILNSAVHAVEQDDTADFLEKIKILDRKDKVQAALIERITLANKYSELDPFSVTLVQVVVRNPDGSVKEVLAGDISELDNKQLAQIKKGQFVFESYGGLRKTAFSQGIYQHIPMIIVDSKKDTTENNRYARQHSAKPLNPNRGSSSHVEHIVRMYPYTLEEQQDRIEAFEILRKKSCKRLWDMGIVHWDNFDLFEASNSEEAMWNTDHNEKKCNALQEPLGSDEPLNPSLFSEDYTCKRAHYLYAGKVTGVYDVAASQSLKKLVAKRHTAKTHDFFEHVATLD